MGLFGTILISVTMVFMLLTLFSLRYICKGKIRGIASLLVIAYNIWIAYFLMSNDRWVHHMSQSDSKFFEAAIMLFMAQLLMFVFIFIAVLLRFGWRQMMKVPEDPSRRRLLKKAAIYPIAAAGLSAYGGFYERTHAVDRDYTIPMPALDESMNGYKIAQISDIHLGAFFTVEEFKALLERIAQHGADVLMVTGDLFDDVAQNAAAGKVLGSYVNRFRHGIYSCIGNHEYYRGGVQMVREVLENTQVKFLCNDAEQVANTGLWVAGVEFSLLPRGKSYEEQCELYLTQAMAKVPDAQKTILLAHHPDFIDNAAERGIPLTLSGHTHGSQLGFLGMPLVPVFKYTRGMVKQGNCYGYVHCGNGSWFPFRLGCPPEIAYFTIQC